MSGIPPGSCLCSTGSRLSSWWHLQWGPARSDWAQAHPSTCKPPWWVQVGAENNRYVIIGGQPQWETCWFSLQLKPPNNLNLLGETDFCLMRLSWIFSKLGNWSVVFCKKSDSWINTGGILQRWWRSPIKNFRSLRPVLFTFCFLNTLTKVYLAEKKIGGRRKVDQK